MNRGIQAPVTEPAPFAYAATAVPQSRAMGGVRTAVMLGAVLVVAAALRLFSFHGYWGTDDGEYALLANAMAHGRYWEFVDEHYVKSFGAPAHLPYRVALIAPLALLFRVFGVSEFTLVAYPLAISLLGVVLAFACARHFFGVRAGLIAAGLWAVVPVDVTYATSFLPDGVASFYASLAILTVLVFGRPGRGPRALFAAGLGAGLLFGISWLSKESVSYLVPFCAILIVSGMRADFRRTVPLWAGVAIASAGVLAAEMAYYAIARGDFMLRMHENERSFAQTQSYLFYEGSRFGWPVGGSHAKALVKRLFLTGPTVFFLNPAFLFLPLFGLLAAGRALFWKDGAFRIAAAWMITLIAMYNFASPTFESYTPLVLLHRYLIPVVLPAIVLTAGLLVRLLDTDDPGDPVARRERIFWGATVSIALIAVCAMATFREIRDLRRTQPMYEVRQLAGLIGPADRVYTDPLSAKALEFHWKFPDRTGLVDFEGADSAAIAPGSFVLVDTNRLDWLDVNVSMWLTKDYGYHEPAFSKTPPASWKVRWRNDYATLYRVD